MAKGDKESGSSSRTLSLEELEAAYESYLEELEYLKSDIKGTRDAGLKYKADSTNEDNGKLFDARLEYMESAFEKFSKVFDKAKPFCRKLQLDINILNNLRISTRELFYEAIALRKLRPSLPSTENSRDQSTFIEPARPLSLPKLKLPEFKGEVDQWPAFQDSFKSLFHENSSLDDGSKFHYLKSCLSGQALQCISSIPVTAQNYRQAWTTLCKKYNNIRLLATTCLTKIFNFKPLSRGTTASLEQFTSVVLESAETFRQLDLEDKDGFILLTFALRLLDYRTKERFEIEYGNKTDPPTFNEFSNFITQQHINLQTNSLTSVSNPMGTNSTSNKTGPTTSKNVLMSTLTTDRRQCPICLRPIHKVIECLKFINEMNPSQRLERINALKRCHNCFSPSHQTNDCPSEKTCRICRQKHHSFLHIETTDSEKSASATVDNVAVKSRTFHRSPKTTESQTQEPPSTTNTADHNPSTANVLSTASSGDGEILLATAKAQILDHHGRPSSIRILVDSGSQRSFLTKEYADRLALKSRPSNERLLGLGGRSLPGGTAVVDCILMPEGQRAPKLTTRAIVVDTICPKVPSCKLPESIRRGLSENPLADPSFDVPGPIDFLLGADLFPDIFTGEVKTFLQNAPKAYKTIFGWILIGRLPETPSTNPLSLFVATEELQPKEERIDEFLKRFWQTEEVSAVSQSDPRHDACEKHFKTTHSRDKTGRYIVRLPFESLPVELGDSKTGALKRYQRLEIRFVKEPNYKLQYDKVLKDYLNQDYFVEAKCPGNYILPHHGVMKTDSTTKLRVVFDASHKTSQGSLNDKLFTGPKLQNDLKDVILRFRNFRFAITNDIYQMYPQIIVDERDRTFQHFLHRFDSSHRIKEYEFQRLTFGMSCSPFLALRVLRQLIADEGKPFPKAVDALTHNIYMDDILAGGDTLEETKTLQNDIEKLLKLGGFSLKEWTSNDLSLTKQSKSSETQTSILLTDSEQENLSQKILGMMWNPNGDVICFKVPDFQFVPTKRGIMSTIARMFDPLGYLSPVTFQAKCILQELWRENLGWDESVSNDSKEKWKQFFEGLPSLTKISIPRRWFRDQLQEICLVGFADASNSGYAAVIYLRVAFTSANVSSSLVIAKTKVAPIKPMTIPRLELCAALLLSKTFVSLQDYLRSLPLPITKTYFLSDSMTILSWLQLPYHRLKTFVANRVAAVLENTLLDDWHHVKSEDNAADIASRGMMPSRFVEYSSWFDGPSWLNEPRDLWPLTSINEIQVNPGIEDKEVKLITTLMSLEEKDYLEEMFSRFSSFPRMIRVFAYLFRFGQRQNPKPSTKTHTITLSEFNETKFKVIKLIQKNAFRPSHFPAEIKSLNPFTDDLGIVRVGGRLSNAPLPYETRHPILLPHGSRFVDLLIDQLHLIHLHAGPQLLLSMFRRSYWTTAARKLIRKRIHLCPTCHRMRVHSYQPKMAPLPSSRFEQGRAFLHVGIDFAGPMTIKESPRRKAALGKSYFCLFVCLATKAVHVELVSQLTSDAFLACLDRFIARRGVPTKIFSDNGRNFTGAERKLREVYQWWSNQETNSQLHNHLLVKNIEWHFIPPLSPHFGGLWEAGIKSLKFHLHRTVGQQPLTFEELSTIGTRVEAILNSRPLYPLSSNAEEFEVLTPGHFLIGAPLSAQPEEDLSNERLNSLSRWQFLQRCIRDIWKKWSSDYLTTLQPRNKWTKTEANLEPGTMVLIREPNTLPLMWTIGRVSETFTGKDDIVRVAKVKTPAGELVRPVVKLSPLFPEEDQD